MVGWSGCRYTDRRFSVQRAPSSRHTWVVNRLGRALNVVGFLLSGVGVLFLVILTPAQLLGLVVPALRVSEIPWWVYVATPVSGFAGFVVGVRLKEKGDELILSTGHMTRMTGVGLAIIAAAFSAVLVLGLSSVRGQGGLPGGGAFTRSCGSVFIPNDSAQRISNLNCREALDSRRILLLAVGIPSLVLGLGVALAGVIDEERTRDDADE